MNLKHLPLALLLGILMSCGTYPMTSFYVKNTSNKAISFDATVIKMSQIQGSYPLQKSFYVLPKDSVLARQTGFKAGGLNPQNWFTDFNIVSVDSIEFNDPKIAENWKKSIDAKGKTSYTFTINK